MNMYDMGGEIIERHNFLPSGLFLTDYNHTQCSSFVFM